LSCLLLLLLPEVTKSDLRNSSDSSGFKYDLIYFFKKIKLIWSEPNLTRSDPNPTWPDSTRDQMTFNPIKIYQKYEKTQYINWPDPIRPNFFQKIRLSRVTRPESEPDLICLIATSSCCRRRMFPWSQKEFGHIWIFNFC
jgi:hypothetical protein